MSEQFFVDEFFLDDTTQVVEVEVRGRKVPITVRRSLGVAERLAAEMGALTKVSVPGEADRVEVDTEKATLILLTKAIVDWPFTDRATGAKLPITTANVARLNADPAPILAALGTSSQESANALDPSGTPSDVASAPVA